MKKTSSLLSILLIGSLILGAALGGNAQMSAGKQAEASRQKSTSRTQARSALAAYATDLTARARQGEFDGGAAYENEVAHATRILARTSRNNPVLVLEPGETSAFVSVALARKLATGDVPEDVRGKNLFRLELSAVLADARRGEKVEAILRDVLAEVEASRGRIILFIDDVHALVGAGAAHGSDVSAMLRGALDRGALQLVGASPALAYEQNLKNDASLNRMLEPVRVGGEESSEKSDEEEESREESGFEGDKISTDLREMIAGGGKKKSVDVILQAADIRDERLRALLSRHGVRVQGQFEQLDAMSVRLPLRAVEELAASELTSYISLDREVRTFGHVEETTGVDDMRKQSGNSALEGDGIGIAILDSGLFKDHDLMDKVVLQKDFTGEGTTHDKYGHGTHVTGLLASKDNVISSLTGLLSSSYVGIAPKAEIVSLRVLDGKGLGRSSWLMNALAWILAPVDPKNPAGEKNYQKYKIRVVNMSSARRPSTLTRTTRCAAPSVGWSMPGIVVVAAAGNNGKNAEVKSSTDRSTRRATSLRPSQSARPTPSAPTRAGDDGVATYSSRGPTRSLLDGCRRRQALRQSHQARPRRAGQQADRRRGGRKENLTGSGRTRTSTPTSGAQPTTRPKHDVPERHVDGDAHRRRRGGPAASGQPEADAEHGQDDSDVHGAAARRLQHARAGRSVALVASQDGRFTIFAWSPCEELVHAHHVEALLL